MHFCQNHFLLHTMSIRHNKTEEEAKTFINSIIHYHPHHHQGKSTKLFKHERETIFFLFGLNYAENMRTYN